jgi:hypothetical protein
MPIVADEAKVEVLEEGLTELCILVLTFMALMDRKTEMHE